MLFNGFDIPFAYPSLSFWFAALLTKAGLDALDVVRVLPILVNIVYVLLFAWLLLRLGHSRLFTAVVMLFFCTRLRSSEWLVMGGGLMVINPFIALGAAAFFLKKDWFWLIAMLLSALVTPRLSSQAWALPIAVLAAQGVLAALVIGRRLVPSRMVAEPMIALAVIAIIDWRVERDIRLSGEYYRPLKPGLRQAMGWVRTHQAGTSFAVLSKAPWYYDSSAEWFPVIADARAVTTVQGREWLSGQYERWVALSKAQKEDRGCATLTNRLRPFGLFDYVWAETHRDCFAGAVPIFSNPDVAIYQAAAITQRVPSR